MAVSVLGFANLASRADHRVPVIMVDAAVPAGGVITAADLTTVSVAAGSGVQLIPARQLSQVTGEIAATALPRGQLLAPSDLTTLLPPGPGQLLVPLPVRPSFIPASGLAPGDHVLAIATPAALGQSASSAASAPAITADVPGVVEAVSTAPNSDGYVVVDLLVASSAGAPLEDQASTGQLALLVASRSP